MGKYENFLANKMETDPAEDLAQIAGLSGEKLKNLHIKWNNNKRTREMITVHDFLMEFPHKSWDELSALAKVGVLRGHYDALKAEFTLEELTNIVGRKFALIAGLTGDQMKNLHIEWTANRRDPKRQAVHDYLIAGNNPNISWDEIAINALEAAYKSLRHHVEPDFSASSSLTYRR